MQEQAHCQQEDLLLFPTLDWLARLENPMATGADLRGATQERIAAQRHLFVQQQARGAASQHFLNCWLSLGAEAIQDGPKV